MEESRKPGSSAPPKYPSHDDEVSADNLGATGVFGAVQESSIDADPDLATKDDRNGNLADGGVIPAKTRRVPVHGDRDGLQEPVVHKVAIGGGSATAPLNLLELLRNNSPEGESAPGAVSPEPKASPLTAAFQAAPAPPAGSQPRQSSEGFTQLLRALSGDSSPASAAKLGIEEQSMAIPEFPGAEKESGSTSLRRTLSPDDGSAATEKRPGLPATPLGTATSDGVGGFTALLQGFSGSGPSSGERQLSPRPLYENPAAASPSVPLNPPMSVPGQATPGTFTQLFSALTQETTNPVAAEPTAMNSRPINSLPNFQERNPLSRPSRDEASFTQLISTVGQPISEASPNRDDGKTVPEDFSARPSQAREDVFASNQPPTGITDWSRPTAPRPQPAYSPESGGLTQLLRTLDGPARGPDIPVAYPSQGETSAPSAAGGSLFTQTYKRLDESAGPLSPEPPPSYAPPLKHSATQPFASPFTGNFFPDQGPSASVAPNLSAGPSDVTRILDASKLREMQRPGGSVPAPAFGSPAAPQPLPAQPAMPQPPAPPQLQWPPPVPPTPAPWQPPQYAPPAPTPQMPVPAASPAPAAPVAMGKMQQYLPLLLIIIIFLLVAILVTVVFLLKH